MTNLNHILVPTDGSEGSLKAAEFAGKLARALNARVSVMYVQSDELVMPHAWGPADFPAEVPYGSMSVEEIRSNLEKRIQETELPDTVSALGSLDSEPQSIMVWGHPVAEVCSFAADNEVDLIVMGSHGRTGIRRMLLGSVSHAVVNEAPCPVTVVR